MRRGESIIVDVVGVMIIVVELSLSSSTGRRGCCEAASEPSPRTAAAAEESLSDTDLGGARFGVSGGDVKAERVDCDLFTRSFLEEKPDPMVAKKNKDYAWWGKEGRC